MPPLPNMTIFSVFLAMGGLMTGQLFYHMKMRVVSLIASATEIVCALGFEGDLVGRSHECDFPESVKRLPVCTRPKFDVHGSSREIDDRVKATLQEGVSVYDVDADLLRRLEPDVLV